MEHDSLISAVINVGGEKLDLLVSPVSDNDGAYLGAMVCWEVITTKEKLITDLTETAGTLHRPHQN